MPLFAAAGNESALVPHDEEEYEEVDEMTSSIDPITMISAIKAQTESAPILIEDEENLRPKKKKKKKSKKTEKSEKEKKLVRGEVEPLKGVYYEHQVKGRKTIEKIL